VNRLAEKMQRYEERYKAQMEKRPTPGTDKVPTSGVWAAVQEIEKFEKDSGTTRRDFILETGRTRRLKAMLSRMQNFDDIVLAVLAS
jgi:hypothetical protein